MAVNAADATLDELTGHGSIFRERLQWLYARKANGSTKPTWLCVASPRRHSLEQERAVWFQSQFREAGWNAAIDRAGNVLATAGEPPYIALTAHLDTVIAPRNKDDISIAPDGAFRGPGVSGQRLRPRIAASGGAGMEMRRNPARFPARVVARSERRGRGARAI